jgi:hypothetical protein
MSFTQKTNLRKLALRIVSIFTIISMVGCSTAPLTIPSYPQTDNSRNAENFRVLKETIIQQTRLDLDSKLRVFVETVTRAKEEYRKNIIQFFDEKKSNTSEYVDYVYKHGKGKDESWHQKRFEQYFFSTSELDNLISQNNANYFAKAKEATYNFAMSIEVEYNFDIASSNFFKSSEYISDQQKNIISYITQLSNKYGYSISDEGIELIADVITASITKSIITVLLAKAGAVLGGAKAGAAAGLWGGPIGVVIGAVVGMAVGNFVGDKLEKEKKEEISSSLNQILDEAKSNLLPLASILLEEDIKRSQTWKTALEHKLVNLKLKELSR